MWRAILVNGMATDLPNMGQLIFLIILKLKSKIVLGHLNAKRYYGTKLAQSVSARQPTTIG